MPLAAASSLWVSLVLLGVAALLLAGNAFFVLAEFAMVRVRASRLDEMVRAGNKRAATALGIVRHLDELLSACQIGITLVSLGLGWVAEPAFADLLHPILGRLPPAVSHTVSTIVILTLVTFLHVVLGELVPKSIAIRKPEASAIFCARSLKVFCTLTHWPLVVLNSTSNAILRLFGMPPSREGDLAHTEEELRLLLSHSQAHGVMSFNRLLLLENAFDFGELTVKDIAVPLDKAVTLSTQAPWEQNRGIILGRKLSRYLLRDGPQGPVRGMVHIKDLLPKLIESSAPPDLPALCRPLMSLGEGVPLETALREMQRRRAQMALALDNAGQPRGMLTLEDILEELVGEIWDEFETERAWSLVDVLPADLILLDLPEGDRRQTLEALVRRTAEKKPEVNAEETLAAVLKREEAVSTAIGEELAIPHARLKSLRQPVVAVARLTPGVDFKAPDGRLVRLIFLILTPASDPLTQVGILARIASILESQFVRDRILSAPTPQECWEALKIGEWSSTR